LFCCGKKVDRNVNCYRLLGRFVFRFRSELGTPFTLVLVLGVTVATRGRISITDQGDIERMVDGDGDELGSL
jgi:hypothetical protein